MEKVSEFITELYANHTVFPKDYQGLKNDEVPLREWCDGFWNIKIAHLHKNPELVQQLISTPS